MVIPGYDPEDIDDALESRLERDELEELLTESELAAYRAGDESLIDLLDESEIRQLFEEEDIPADAPD